MNLMQLSEQLYNKLEDQLDAIKGTAKPALEKFSDALFEITQTLDQLKRFIIDHDFENRDDEINCFKNIFPKFYAWYIYLTEEYNIISAVPIATDEQVRDYYLQELALVKRNLNQEQFAYQYFMRGETALDEHFFLRENMEAYLPAPALLFVDKNFATNQGYQFACFRAYEMLQDFIIKRIRLLYQAPENTLLAELLTGKNRRWTGEKINLVELAYGIYYTGQMNDGKAGIDDIVAWLEESLQIDLGRAYRKFIDIRRRKTLSYTKYLDEMREAIHHKIDESNRYKPKPLNRHTNEKKT